MSGVHVVVLSHSVRGVLGGVGRSRRATAERVAGRPTRRRRRGAAAAWRARRVGKAAAPARYQQQALATAVWCRMQFCLCSLPQRPRAIRSRRSPSPSLLAAARRRKSASVRAAEAAQDGRGVGGAAGSDRGDVGGREVREPSVVDVHRQVPWGGGGVYVRLAGRTHVWRCVWLQRGERVGRGGEGDGGGGGARGSQQREAVSAGGGGGLS
jgi:hypothetical protein